MMSRRGLAFRLVGAVVEVRSALDGAVKIAEFVIK